MNAEGKAPQSALGAIVTVGKGLRSRPVIDGAVVVLLVAYVRFFPGVQLPAMLILEAYVAVGGLAWGPLGCRLSPPRD